MNYRRELKLIKWDDSLSRWKIKQASNDASAQIQYFMLINFHSEILVKSGRTSSNPQNRPSRQITAPKASDYLSVVGPYQNPSPASSLAGTLCPCNSSHCGRPWETDA